MSKNLKIILAVSGAAVVFIGIAVWGLRPALPVPEPEIVKQQPAPQQEEAPKPPETVPPEVLNGTIPSTPAKENESVRRLNIKEGDTIKSPLKIKGEALGGWFFEASFPIQVVDDKGRQLGQGIAKAKGEWMKATYVPFEATITYTTQGSLKGMVIFSKDNPSGLPENAEGLVLNVKFASQEAGTTGQITPPPPPTVAPKPVVQSDTCRPTGCSRHVCSDTDVVTTCEYRSEFACYKSATCARQSDGKCGWTQTPTLKSCIETALKDTNPPQ